MAAYENGGGAFLVRSIEDVRRAREFYRYLDPSNLVHPNLRRRGSSFDSYHEHVPSISAALAPYCQLTALRCNAKKAMLNCMDGDVMYFLAEASRQGKSNLTTDIYDFVEDPILMSCSSVPLKGRICELTIKTEKSNASEEAPMFVIPDLAASEFSHLSIISGPPYYRFYAGTPITTRDGINIGSLAIMDDQPRDALTPSEEAFLSNTAAQIMIYLETNRQAIEGRRSRKMAKGLESFIAGKRVLADLARDWQSKKGSSTPVSTYGFQMDPDGETKSLHATMDKPTDAVPPAATATKSSSLSSETTVDEGHGHEELNDDSNPYSKTFSRAANLLRECLDVGEEGSVTFFSVGSGFSAPSKKTSSGGGEADSAGPRGAQASKSQSSGFLPHRTSTRPATIIACSTQNAPFMNGDDSDTKGGQIDDVRLYELTSRYPNGKLWNFDDMRASSSEDDSSVTNNSSTSSGSQQPMKRRRRDNEADAVKAAFPEARQVLFAPLFDTASATFAHGVFIVTTLETRSFDDSADLSFLHAFCSTIMAENSRLDLKISDRQKSDFVGTISHEMRSPLHGVLASVEFLSETDVTGFQKSLIDTIDSCGKTLLDTINHVLDYSKINSFKKQWDASNRKQPNRRNHYLGPESSSKLVSQNAPPLLQMFGVTDISAILEEVLDGLVLGYSYNSGVDITDMSREARGRSKAGQGNSGSTTSVSDPVGITLDVLHADYLFVTQPGAVRRIIMNIIGNAIKYTDRGSINVKLELKGPTQDKDTEVMLFTVADTGRGISQSFLNSKLFVPFAQENALAPGTGLGLSIVQSIVSMLGGSIDVNSRIGKGTTVQVALPLRRPLPGQQPPNQTPTSGETIASTTSSADESVAVLQNQATDLPVALYLPEATRAKKTMEIVSRYVKDWYHLPSTKDLQAASVILTEEQDLESLAARLVGTPGKRPAIVVLCSVASRLSISAIKNLETRIEGVFEFVSKPCGPHKLARCIRLVLEKKRDIIPKGPQVGALESISEVDNIGDKLHEIDLRKPDESSPGKVVHATEDFAISQASEQAQKAIHSPNLVRSLRSPGVCASEGDAFPFPEQEHEQSRKRRQTYRGNSSTTGEKENSASSLLTSNNLSEKTLQPVKVVQTTAKVDPHVLLVDDNKINLKLLETFLRSKQKYTRIVQAEDGKQAVDAVKSTTQPFEIIFMDISMPIMNGFEATRAIREYEDSCGVTTGAMIIALTGLASGRDQSEGFDSGCDIYMTKPVSFKEVSKLLTNWEAHQKLGTGLETVAEQ